MSGRVTSPLLLVGSLPADSTEEALRAGAELFGDLVFALPGRRDRAARGRGSATSAERLVRPHPDVETVQETESPTGIPRHAYETPVFTVRDGRRRSCTGTSWPRIDDAIASYERFRALRDEGVIPARLRFQVGLPFPSSALNGFKADFAARLRDRRPRASRTSSRRELERLTRRSRPRDLAIQWDVCYEVLDIEGVRRVDGRDGAWERFAGPGRRG